MIARVTLEIALRKEFDYLIPPELGGQVEVGTRVKVPFGPRKVMGCVTALVEQSPHTNLRALLNVVGTQALVTPKILKLARWIADYYCCPVEFALKSVLPESVRKERAGWRERLVVRALPLSGDPPKLTKRQQGIWNIIEEWRELPLQELLGLADTTADTVRKLEDKGLVSIGPQISERDPYANEHILPTQPLALNPDQAAALEKIKGALGGLGSTRVPPEKVLPASCRRDLGSTSASPFLNKEAEVGRYSGWLPHWRQQDKLYFVTFRLEDSVAQTELAKWREEKEIWEAHHPKPWSDRDWAEYDERFTERMERLLDAGYGSCALARPDIGGLVEQALRHFDGARYRLGDFVVMPNHVHALVQPAGGEELAGTLHSWKSFTAKEANARLGTKGTFWRDEYFDHLVRSEAQFHKFCGYIRDNPTKARLESNRFRLGAGSFILPWVEQSAAGILPAWQNTEARVPFSQASGASAGGDVCRRDASSTFLLHGVTGSGKTEVYLQAIAHCLQQGKGAIVLVPEISLTPQTVERFKGRFRSGALQTLVAVLHSHLSAGERHDEWHKIRQGRARIVIGARSAIFAPVDPLGLIIVDEEHEHSYKQEEAPRYHARDVAVMRGQMEGAAVVLGSATPSMESFFNAQNGKYALLNLPQRADDKKMPLVRVIDMRQEARKEKGTPIFSQKLKEEITRRLEQREQVMLFLNRRGYATSLQCPKCGYVAECPNCSVSLTYHRSKQKICCHICGHESPAPSLCPNQKCRNPAIRYSGLGTEKVEDTLAKLFPRARVRRMDSDTLKRKEDYRRILGDFRTGKIDILVGTQMIAKGLHFPNVTLVGIIYADLSLHQPDFRAGERTFQLLTQVAGRAGRGDVEGEVVVQAFTPFHPAIQYARRHDFIGFYEQEIEFREQLRYPPLTRAALLTLKGRNEEKVKFSADHVRKALDKLTSGKASAPLPGGEGSGSENSANLKRGEVVQSKSSAPSAPTLPHPIAPFRDLVIAGPAPAPLLRAETYYRYQLMLRTRQMSRLSQSLANLLETLSLPDDVSLTVDIDPVNLV